MEKQNTPLMTAIDFLKNQIKEDERSEFNHGVFYAITYLESLLPMERQQLIDAYKIGHERHEPFIDVDQYAELYNRYFTETFKTREK
jgi:hypothetical protein